MKVLVGMSGGIDSSVAAALLAGAGHDVAGVSMEIWDREASGKEIGQAKHGCYGPGESQDIEDAREIARILGIPFFTIDVRKEYHEHVIDYVKREYIGGRTPNPCAMCNHRIKFGYLLQKARESGIGFDFFATGHYVIKYQDEMHGRFGLRKASDRAKDQSYFLSFLEQHQLERTLFPLGTHHKSEVRELARKYRLPVAEKPESQDFVGKAGYSSLFEEPSLPGPILDLEGNVRGTHSGIIHYTIGQRKGLGISDRNPLYVLKIDRDKNAIIVGPQERLYSPGLTARDMNWIGIAGLESPQTVKAKIRSAHKEEEALISPLEGNRVDVQFRNPQMGPTPGQVVVFYEDDRVLGGGIIE